MRYKVNWSKAYYISGTETVEANSQAEAEEKVDAYIGDLEGSMQYTPEDNLIEANPCTKLSVGTKVKIIVDKTITTGAIGKIEKYDYKLQKYKVGFDSSWVGWYRPEEIEEIDETI